MKVYQQIAAVSAALAASGISKARTNAQQGYAFRGIDDVFNALAPLLAKHGLVILPRILSRVVTERQARNGGVLFGVVVEAEFDLVAAEDGSHHTVRTFGEAMDSADKATNKAMSAAYKYAALQTFCVPTEGDHDADAQTPEPVHSRRGVTRLVTSSRQADPPPPTVTNVTVATISEDQRKRFFAISKAHGWKTAEVKALLRRVLNVEKSADIPTHRYKEVVKLLEGGVDSMAVTS